MENIDILKPLLEKGLLKDSLALAESEGRELLDVTHDGLNFVTASILADIPSVEKTDLIKKTGAFFSTQDYCSLLNEKIFTVHPETRERLKAQGVILTEENIKQYSNWHNIFEIAFPWLPLSVFEDLVVYLREEKRLILDKETRELVKENFINSKRYSERELKQFFKLPIFDEEI
ncbi:MAG: hypothetical protein ACTTH8_00545 [Treponema sp.]